MTFDDADRDLLKKMLEDILPELLIHQNNIFPDSVKQRHVGEGVRFIRSGLAADLPTTGEKEGATYFSYDTNVLSVWNGTAWVSETLT